MIKKYRIRWHEIVRNLGIRRLLYETKPNKTADAKFRGFLSPPDPHEPRGNAGTDILTIPSLFTSIPNLKLDNINAMVLTPPISDGAAQEGPCQSSRRARLAKSQACSSRSPVSLESVHSIFSLDSDCSDDEHEHTEDSIVTIKTGFVLNGVTDIGDGLKDEDSIQLIQESWNALLNKKNDKRAVGEQIVMSMLEIKPSYSTSLGVSPLPTEQTPRFAELCTKMVDMLDRLVQTMKADLCDEDLAEEWMEEGLDARLVHKAIIHCLEDSLDTDDYSFEAARAWSTTFRDVMQKVFMF